MPTNFEFARSAPSQIRPQLDPPSDWTVWQVFLQRFGLEGETFFAAGRMTFRFAVDIESLGRQVTRYEVILAGEGRLPDRAKINGQLYRIDDPMVDGLIRAMEFGGRRPSRT